MQQAAHKTVQDEDGRRAQTAFAKFLRSYEDSDGYKLYMEQIDELKNPGRNTLYVKFSHICAYSAVLSSTIGYSFIVSTHSSATQFVIWSSKNVTIRDRTVPYYGRIFRYLSVFRIGSTVRYSVR
uniref:MCM N-terminal domain-containing protein n=1 Tax=Meloidogyne incognita TaxID=6306 RepID=A0A914MKT7_MELIC